MRILLVGDPHIRLQDIQSGEADRFADWIVGLALEKRATVTFLGDQFNDHGIVRIEVLKFWKTFYSRLRTSISIVGNHDMNADSTASAMEVFDGLTMVISKFTKLSNGISAAPFFRKHEDLYDALSRTEKVLICHAEFNGAEYENGFYAPGGADLGKIPEKVKVISGHIHKKQILGGKVWYLGTPRMLSRSDIGEVKCVHIFDTESGTYEVINTPESVCEPFKKIEINEQNQDLSLVSNSSRCFVDIKGSEEFIAKMSKKMPEKAQVRVFKNTQKKDIQIRESDGIGTALMKYINEIHEFGSTDVKDKAIGIISKSSSILGKK